MKKNSYCSLFFNLTPCACDVVRMDIVVYVVYK